MKKYQTQLLHFDNIKYILKLFTYIKRYKFFEINFNIGIIMFFDVLSVKDVFKKFNIETRN